MKLFKQSHVLNIGDDLTVFDFVNFGFKSISVQELAE